ncbi:MAG: hypothetical protein JRC68_05740 [Deltaproteobacteria bacterium]|nr:hypothetical protein [Deltaproteobacteria bacterium]
MSPPCQPVNSHFLKDLAKALPFLAVVLKVVKTQFNHLQQLVQIMNPIQFRFL